MKKYIFTAALVLVPAIAMAEHPEGGVINGIKSEIRDDYRQLHEDEDAGHANAVRDDERQIAEDKMRLREAEKHPNRMPSSPPPGEAVVLTHDDTAVSTPPPPPDHDEVNDKTDRAAKLNPDHPFNRSASVDNEIR